MKRSTAVVLVLSGAMLGGCGRREEQAKPAAKESQVLTNDTYVAGRGYYHSAYHMFFPFPYNHHSPGMGFYRGGRYHAQPDLTAPKASYPGRSYATTGAAAPSQNVNRGGFTRSPNRSGSLGSRSWGS